jgi:hypothetical protein
VSKGVLNDPDAIWSTSGWQFPGSGREHPIQPGETVVIALQAQDHSHVHWSLPDLSGADFELEDPGGADNPAAPNLLPVGPHPTYLDPTLAWSIGRYYFLTEAVEVESLPVMRDPGYPADGPQIRGYPTEKILDATVVWWDTSEYSITIRPFCWHPVYPGFDRIPGGYIAGASKELGISAARRALPLLDGSGNVLLDTGTSRVDFVRADQTPGWIQ